MKKTILDKNFNLFLKRFNQRYNFKKRSAKDYDLILSSKELPFEIPVLMKYDGRHQNPFEFNLTFRNYPLGLVVHASGTCVYEKEFFQRFNEPIADGDVSLFSEDIFTAKEFKHDSITKESNVLESLFELIINLGKPLTNNKLKKNDFFFEKYTKTIYLNNSSSYLSFLENFILAPLNSDEVFRYMDFNGAFQIINSQNYRLSSIMGMNDQTEGASFVNSIYSQIPDHTPSIQLNTIRYFNNIFISSCTIKSRENLTMWRLYGDNSKGTCLKLLLNGSKETYPSFFFGLVNYVQALDERTKQLAELMTNLHLFSGYILDPRIFYYISYFTKDDQYRDEKEVRILLDLNTTVVIPSEVQWSIVDKLNIIRPYIDIPLDILQNSISIKEIILGPNCPQQARNIKQLKILHDIKRTYPIEIKASSLKPDLYLG